jgi:hypothetical protein
MTRNEIEHMWKVASNNPNHDTNWHDPVVEAFAKLVAQHERERFYGQDKPAECSEGCPPKQICDYCQLVAPVKAMILSEREACAKVCDAMNWYMDDGEECAAAIRARGQA